MTKIGYFERNTKIRMDDGLNDSQIRQAIIKVVKDKLPTATIVEEFQILHNSVVDVGVLGENKLVGFEIKSSYDTVEKLHEQMKDYIRFFHQVDVITTKHLLNDVIQVLSAPEFVKVGIIIANIDDLQNVKLKRYKGYYRIEHTKAHFDWVFGMTGLDSKLRPYLKELRNKWGIVGERYGKEKTE